MEFLDDLSLFLVPEKTKPNYAALAKQSDEKLVVLISKEDSTDSNLELLAKICSATGFDYEKNVSRVLISEEQPLSMSNFFELHKHSVFLSFGDHEPHLKTQFNKIKYWWMEFNDHAILFADSLTRINNQQNLKKMLWEALKQKFI